MRPLLALLTGVALLFPEVGHGLAHHHAAEHRGDGQSASHGVLPDEHGHGEHPHLAMVASPPAKPLFQYAAVVVRVATLILDDIVLVERPRMPVESAGLSPGNLPHGPPPPPALPPRSEIAAAFP